MGNLVRMLEKRYLSRALILVMDVCLSTAASLAVFGGMDLLFDVSSPVGYSAAGWISFLGGCLLASLVSFCLTRTYRIIIRHLSVGDLIPFFFAVLLKEVLVLGGVVLSHHFVPEFVMLLGIDFLATLFLLLFTRMLMILVWNYFNHRIREKYAYRRVLVYGVSEKSVSLILRMQHSSHYRIIGFLAEEGTGRMIDGFPVFTFKTEEQMQNHLLDNRIDAVLFAQEEDVRSEEDRLILFCNLHNIKSLVAPSLSEVEDGKLLSGLREVKVEDLLGREEIKISMEAIRAYFNEKTVLVTGAAGSIGSELCRLLAGFGVKKLVLFDNAETPMHNLRLELEDRFPELCFVPVIGDVRQVPRLDFVFRTHHPQVVFHAAAYKHVPLMEENPCEAVLVNVCGTRHLADKCVEYGAEKMVMISTDKAVNPTNIMGCTKRLAEIYVQSLGLSLKPGEHSSTTKFVTTRFGNVLGSNGSVIPRFQQQIAAGGPVTVTHPDINRFFMTIPEACRLVMEAATMSTGNQIFVFDMGRPVKIDTLARRMITLAGFKPDEDIKIEYTGLRPGEKLYEEVLADEENSLPSFHDRIRIAKVREYDYEEACSVIDRLEELSRNVEIPDMVRLMKRTVPEFKSAESRFEAIDRELENENKQIENE